jgi:hypothetical protein
MQLCATENHRPAPRPAALREDAVERRHLARRRYPLRPLLCSLAEGAPPGAVSARGLVVRASAPMEPGRALLVQLPGPCGGAPHTRLARVRRVSPRPGGEFLVACDFTLPLDEQELAAVSLPLGVPA